MRFLCLHGLGTSSEILKAQTESIRAALSSEHSFHFIDGDHTSPPAEGISSIYPGPYYSYYVSPTAKNVAEAHELLDEVIAEDGPFDAVLGFSQGAALASSYLLHHTERYPSEPAPFRLAVFLSSSLPFSVTKDFGFDITDIFFPHAALAVAPSVISSRPRDIFVASHDMGAFLSGRLASKLNMVADSRSQPSSVPATPGSPSAIRSGTTTPSYLSSTTSSSASTPGSASPLSSGYQTPLSDVSEPPSDDEADDCDDRIRRYHPSLPVPKIGIATVHIYGKQDQYYSQSRALRDLCVTNKSTSYEHAEGHVVPRGAKATRGIIEAIEKAMRFSCL